MKTTSSASDSLRFICESTGEEDPRTEEKIHHSTNILTIIVDIDHARFLDCGAPPVLEHGQLDSSSYFQAK